MILLSSRGGVGYGTGDSVVDGNLTFFFRRGRYITATASRTRACFGCSSSRPCHFKSGRLNPFIEFQDPRPVIGGRDLKPG